MSASGEGGHVRGGHVRGGHARRGATAKRGSVDLVAQVLEVVGELTAGGAESAYEVDVIIRCHPAPPWRVHRAFWHCVARGWIVRSGSEPDAFVLAGEASPVSSASA